MQIIRSKRRTLSVEVQKNGLIIVRAPIRASQHEISAFLNKKQRWILRTQAYMQKTYGNIKPKQYYDGETFLFLGNAYPLRIVTSSKRTLQFNEQFELSQHYVHLAKQQFIRWYQQQARLVISDRTDYFSNLTRLSYQKLRITDAKKRWGSCSYDNNLSFAWRLIMAPLPAIDYVIVHELVHTIHKNHGKRFWRKVEKILPHYAPSKRWLYENGHHLTLG